MSKSKRIISLLMAGIMLVSATVTVKAQDQSDNPKFYAMPVTKVSDSGLMFSNIENSTDQVQTFSRTRSVLPERYNAFEKYHVTWIKDQGNTGTCWAHAALSACESSLIKNNGFSTGVDLSELHLTYALYNKKYDKMGMLDSEFDTSDISFLNMGGAPADVMFTLANWQGVVLENLNMGQFSSSKMHLPGANAFKVYNPNAMYLYNDAVLTDCYRVPLLNQDLVKQYIMEYGSGTLNLNANIDYLNFETSTFYCYDPYLNGVNHEVALVGWDDNYPKNKCTVNGHTPKSNGAWLVKNSWGVEIGNDGYFWVSYEDNSIQQYPSNFYALDTEDKYINNYQYDDLSSENVLCDSANTVGINSDGYMANIYTSYYVREALTAVAFVTSNPDVDYKIDVYTNVTSIPTDGTLSASISGNMPVAGYHTVDLETPISINRGEKFAIVVYLGDNDNPERTMFFNIDASLHDYENKVSKYGESFFSYDGSNWEDMKDSFDGNFRIKAFTTSGVSDIDKESILNSYKDKSRGELTNNLEALLEEYAPVYESYLVYSDDTYADFIEIYEYAYSGYESNSFIAIELYHIAEELKVAYSKLEPYDFADTFDYYYDTIVDNVEYYDTLPNWDKFLNAYNSVVEQSKTLEPNMENLDTLNAIIQPAFVEYMTYAINHGSMDSFIQKFGDVDNSNDINIQDATLTQMYVAKQKEMDYYISYNGDVDGDGEVNIKDATNIQMMVAKLLNYFPIYDIDLTTDIYNSERPKNEITYDSALAKLQTAVTKLENHPYFEFLSLLKQDVSILTVLCLYDDAKAVLSNPSEYSPQEMNFKAQYLFLWLNVLYNM